MNKNLKINLIYSFFLIFIYLLLLLSISIFFVEFFNIGSRLLKNDEKLQLHNTNYYKKKIDFHPYEKFDKKYIHPFLTFSMPSRAKDISKINNEFINLNEFGYRINPYNKAHNINSGVLLGGSTAFGYYASSDKTTLAALITKSTNYNIFNLNGPSWNSHQELISLIKFDKDYKLSISFSGNNDLDIFCSKTINTEFEENYVDLVEQYEDINKLFLSLTENRIYQIELDTIIKYFIANNFDETLKLKYYFKTRNKKKNLPIQSFQNQTKCIKNGIINYKKIDKSVKKFLYNQTIMRLISNSKGAEHYLILQPRFYSNEDDKKKIYNYAYNMIMDSNFCKKNCYDFSNIFINYSLKSFMNNFTGIYKDEIFIDRIHLSDVGNTIVSEKILDIIDFQ